MPQFDTRIDLPGADQTLFGVGEHLHPVGHPAAGAGYGEQYGEHACRQFHGPVDKAGVEIYVGVQFS